MENYLQKQTTVRVSAHSVPGSVAVAAAAMHTRQNAATQRIYRLAMLTGLLLVFLMLGALRSSAQDTQTGRETVRGEVNFSELANYLLLHPEPLVVRDIDEDDDEDDRRPYHPLSIDPALVHHHTVTPGAFAPVPTPSMPVSPAPTDTFGSAVDNNTSIPPDTHGAVDSNYCVTATNQTVKIQTRAGAAVSSVSLNSFFVSVAPSGGVFDPRVHYDPYTHRWMIIAVDGAQSTSSSIVIAISKTSNPTGAWWTYSVLAYGGGDHWLDFPNVGFNNKWITITGNLFPNTTGSYAGCKVFMFNKANLLAGTSASYTAFTQVNSFTICPALTYDPSEPTMFAVESSGDDGTLSYLQFWRITGAVGSETMTSLGYETAPPWQGGAFRHTGTSGADFAPQSGTSNLVQTNDDRIDQMTFMNGKLWFAHAIFLPFSSSVNATRSAVQWWQTDTAGNAIQIGRIDDATGTNFYAFPTLAVNSSDDAFIGFSQFSAGMHPSSAYALRLHTDPADSIRTPVIYRHGLNTYYKTFSGSKNRWGDYSAATVDILNMTDFYTIQEAASATANIYDTWWAHVNTPVGCTTPSAISGSLTICSASTTTLSDATPSGTWTSNNTSVATVGSASGVVTGVASGTAVISYTVSGGCYITATVTVNALPAAIGGSAHVCLGSTATYTDATGGGTWSSSNGSIATINASSGLLATVAAGSCTITYTLGTGCLATKPITVDPLPASISGSSTICAGSTSTYTDATGGGSWSSSSTGVATIVAGTGVASGVNAGTATLTYTLTTGCFVTKPVTVVVSPSAITGSSTICNGANTTLTDTSAGGTWSSANSGIASIDASSGIVTGASVGSTVITYTVGSCYTTFPITVNTAPAAITGPSSVCVGSTITLADVTSGGTWSSVTTPVATVGSLTGIVTGVSISGTTIYYTLGNGCSAFKIITVTAGASAISGVASVCVGGTTTLTDAGGGTWTSGNTSVATVGSLTGTVTGVGAGTATITYTLGSGCTATRVVTVNPAPGVITGPSVVCVGTTATLSDTSSGSWASGTTGVATIDPTTGVVTTLNVGTTIITFTAASGCTTSMVLSVTATPSPISGAGTVCLGSTTTLTDAGGGSWSSSATGVATIGATTGVVTPVSPGVTTITYSIGTGCTTTMDLTVNPAPAAIAGATAICAGTSTTLSDTGSGVWTSGTPGVATIGSATGIVAAVNSGTTTITYTAPGGCFASMVLTVNPLPAAIAGTTSVCVGGTTTLTDAGGGTWTSGTPTVATIGSATGLVTALLAGTTVITYTLPTGCSTTTTFTVTSGPGAISGPSSVCIGGTATLTDAGGGTWSSGTPGVATIGATTGVITTLNVGTTLITYSIGGSCTTTLSFTVNPLPAAITGASSICAGASTTYSDATPGGTWSSSNTGVGTIDATTGIISSINAGTTVISYTSASGCSITKTLTVNALPAIYTMTGGGGYCTGGTGVLVGLAGSQSGVTYQLYLGGVATGSPVAGTGAAISFGLKTAVGTYTVVATGTGTACSSNMSGALTVSVFSLPTAFSVTGGGSYCAGGAGVHVGLSGSQVGVNYQLYRGATADGSPVAGTGSALDFGLKTLAATYTVVASSASGGCNSTMSGNAVVAISPAPTAYAVTGGGTFCAGGVGFHVGLSGSQVGVSYQLYLNVTTPVGAPVAGTGSGLDWGYQTTAGTYTVVASLSGSCPVNMTGNAIITVIALPVAYTVTGGGGYCLGAAGVHVGLSNSEVGVSYQLYRGGTTIVGAPVAGSGAAIDFGVFTTAGTYTVKATRTTGGCLNTMSGSVTITVNTPPTAYSVTGGGAYCTGTSGPHVGLANSTVGVNYQLYLGGIAVGAPVAGVGGALDFGAQVSGGTYTVVGTSAATGCSTTMTGSAFISVSSIPSTFTVSGGGSMCSGTPGLHVLLSGSSVTVTYYLYRNGVGIGSLAGTGSPLDYGAYTTAGTYTVSAMSTLTGCSSNQPGSAVITVVAPPSAGTITGPSVVATGATITLADATPGGTWSSSNAHATVSPVGVVTGVSAGAVTISYSVSNGVCTISALKYITETGPTPPPPAGVISGNTTICVGGVTDLTSSVSGGTWTSGNTNVATVDPLLGRVQAVNEGIAPISYTVDGSEGLNTVVMPVTVAGAPQGITLSANPGLTIQAGQSVTFTVATSNPAAVEKYQWYRNGVAISNADRTKITLSDLSDHEMIACDVTGICGDPVRKSVVVSFAGQGTVIATQAATITVQPNPGRDVFNVVGTLGTSVSEEEVQLDMTDVLGKVIYSNRVTARNGMLNESIRLTGNVASGVYLLNIRSSAGSQVFRLVVKQ